MGSIIFDCPQCGGAMEAEQTGLRGRLVECPHCQAQVQVPAGDEGGAVEEASAEPPVAQGGGSGLPPGTMIRGVYKIVKLLGESSLGDVYVAEVVPDGRKVQLEVISGGDQETIDRLSREIELLAAMQHPNIVRAFDAGQDNEIFFLASDYEDGQTLLDLLKSGPIAPAAALEYTKCIASALDHAWEHKKILHRDIKPSNIFITNSGSAKLMGFGIAKSSEGQSMGLTGVGFTVGTPEYMSPEQIKAEEDLDYRADMYSLGCVLYEMLTGRLPFVENAPILLMQKHMDEDPEPANIVNPNVPEACADLVEAMMTKEREDRPATWDELIGFIDNAKAASRAPVAAQTGAGDTSGDGGSAPVAEQKKGKFGCAGMLAMAACAAIGIGVVLLKLL